MLSVRAIMVTNAKCCAYGALIKEGRLTSTDIQGAYVALMDIVETRGYSNLAKLNDERGHGAVIDVYNSAISLIEAEEAVNKI